MDNSIRICHGTLIITFRCSLKCKLCCVYAPYYRDAEDYSADELKKTVDMFFKVIDFCDVFNIQGGEPLLHRELPEIIDHVMEYRGQMRQVLLTTNGTLLPSKELLETLAKYRDCLKVNISNYGPNLSKCVPEVIALLNEYNIPNHVFKYYGDDMHYGGWLDFTDHTYKNMTEDEIIKQCEDCGCRREPQFAIRGHEMFCCGRVMRRVDLGVIEKNDESCVDLFDNKPIEDKRKDVFNIIHAKYTPACPYCTGKRAEREHVDPAVQLTREELAAGVEKMDAPRA